MNAPDDTATDDPKRALIAAAELVAAMFAEELLGAFIKSYPHVDEKLSALTIELEAVGYLEKYREGYAVTEDCAGRISCEPRKHRSIAIHQPAVSAKHHLQRARHYCSLDQRFAPASDAKSCTIAWRS